MKLWILFEIAWLVLASFAHAQNLPPHLAWQNSFGGSGDDILWSVTQTSDRGFAAGGWSDPPVNASQTASTFAGKDFWLIRLDAAGQSLWTSCFGGAGEDLLYAIKETSDGGFLMGGWSNSDPGGGKSSPHFGAADFWVVRIDRDGNKLWDRSFGGSGDDLLFALAVTPDGGFLLGGWSNSPMDGNKTSANLGGRDFWIVRIDASGQFLWDRSLGGPGDDLLYTIEPAAGGGFWLGGSSTSISAGTKTSPNRGGNDYWVVRLDAQATPLFDRTFGGTGNDYLRSLKCTSDGGAILGGWSYSGIGGNKSTPNAGASDFWVVRLDSAGQKLWERSLGGTGYEELYALVPTATGGFLLGGTSDSPAGESKTSPHFGSDDFWIVALDGQGSYLWDQSWGGSGLDRLLSMDLTATGDFVLAGLSDSPSSGNKQCAVFGGWDGWVLNLRANLPRLEFQSQMKTNIQSAGFIFRLTAESNQVFLTEFSTDLVRWFPLQTNYVDGDEVQIVDMDALDCPARFYRARRLPAP